MEGTRGHDGRRRIIRRRALSDGIGVGLGAAAFLAACGGGDNSSKTAATSAGAVPAGTAATDQSKLDLNATVRAAYGAFPANLDPHTAAARGIQAATNGGHYGTIFAGDERGLPIQGGPADFAFVDDNRAFQIKLRPGTTFHNGEPLDAEQVKWNLERNLGRATYNPKFVSAWGSTLSWIGDMNVVDPMTLKLQLAKVNVDAAFNLLIPLVPMGFVTKNGDEALAKQAVGTGPYKFQSWIPDQEIKSVRNDAFPQGRDFKGGPRLPYIQNLTARLVPELQARLAALEAGEVEIAMAVSPDLAKGYEGRKEFTVFYHPAQRGLHLELPVNVVKDAKSGGPNPWRDVRVRKAANLAIDLDTIIKKLMTGREILTYPVSSGQGGFPPDLPSKRYKFDPAQAKALLAQAGQTGFEFDFNYPPNAYANDKIFVEAIAGYLRDVGFKVNIIAGDASNYFTQAAGKKIPGPYLFPQPAGFTPLGALTTAGTSTAQYAHPAEDVLPEHKQVDVLVATAATEFDEAKRNSLLQQAVTIHYENALWVYLFELVQPHVAKSTLAWTPFALQPAAVEMWNVQVRKG